MTSLESNSFPNGQPTFVYLFIFIHISALQPTTTYAPAEADCPADTSSIKWFPYGDSCYSSPSAPGSITSLLATWDVAQNTCLSVNAHLASIHHSFENSFVGGIVKHTYAPAHWIGMRRAAQGQALLLLIILF